MQEKKQHFFISYNKTDITWAEWIAWVLEDAGYAVTIQAWDFRPGFNFFTMMRQKLTTADRVRVAAIELERIRVASEKLRAGASRLEKLGALEENGGARA